MENQQTPRTRLVAGADTVDVMRRVVADLRAYIDRQQPGAERDKAQAALAELEKLIRP